MDMRIGTCNVRSLYRAGSLKRLASKLAKYKIDGMRVAVRQKKIILFPSK
jgi:hypothetical protein